MALEIDLSGKIALITGVSSGIGLAIAETMAAAGAVISGCARDQNASAFVSKLSSAGHRFLYTSCDVTDDMALDRLVGNTIDTFGGIDILVSNAGANVFTGAEHCTEKEWNHNLQLNLTSHWSLSRKCKSYLEKNNGVIIIMTSNHAFSSIPGCFPYNVTKTALTGLVRSLAIEWGPAIRTVGIAPGFIDTPGNQLWFDSFKDPLQERQRTIDMHPVKRIGTPGEIGAWCAFLASRHAAFASGTTYLVDGGRSALMQDEDKT